MSDPPDRRDDEPGASSAAATSRGNEPALPELARKHGVDPFALFAAYHLGLTETGEYQFQNLHQVAKRFGAPAGVIKQLLTDLAMDADAVVHAGFDMASAQVDVMHPPPGVSRTELARKHYEAFRNAPRQQRDWEHELADDARANEATYAPGARGSKRGPGDAS